MKMTVDSEFDDWMLNRSEEDWLVVRNIKRLPKMSSSDWQAAAKQQITDLFKMVLNLNRTRLDFEVLLVVNPLRHIPTGPTLYNVRMDSVYTSDRLRTLYSGFFRKNRPVSLPPALKGVDVRNKITLGSKIRIAILHQLGSIYTASNQGSQYQVRGFESRPMLVTKPAPPARPRSYTFIQAATTLKSTFSDENLIRIYQVVGTNMPGELRALFIVLNDDDRDRCLSLGKASREQRGGASGSGHCSGAGGSSVNFLPVQSTSGVVRGSGSGMEVESRLLASISSPPPPPLPPTSSEPEPDPESAIRPKGPLRQREPSSSPPRAREPREPGSSPPRASRGTKRRKQAAKKSKRSRRYSSSSSSSSSGSSSSSSSSSSSDSSRERKSTRSKSSKSQPKSKSKKS